MNTAEQTEEYYLGLVLDRLKIVSAGYINPRFVPHYDYTHTYTGNEYYGVTYKANYITNSNINSVEEAQRVAVAPTEVDSFIENKNTNKDNRVRRFYIYENAEPNVPVQYQTYLPRYISNSTQYLLATIDVEYDDLGQVKTINAINISWENNNIQVTIRYSKKFNIKLNKVDYYDSNQKLNAAFDVLSNNGASLSVASGTKGEMGKVYAGKTVKYTLSETAVPAGYIPIENMDILVEFNNNGSIRNVESKSEYFELIKIAPVDEAVNSINKIDLEANIKNKPRFDISIELSDKFYETLKLSGATFAIENNKGDVATGGITTDIHGIMQTYIGTVYPNEDVIYTVRQTNIIAGYNENNCTIRFKVHFNSNGKLEDYSLIEGENVCTIHPNKHIGTKEVKLNITNTPKDVKVGIYKYDDLNKNKMSNVKFKVTAKETGKVDVIKDNIVTNSDGTAVDVIDNFKETTEKNRVVTYIISEIEAAPSYRKIQDVEIKVTYNSDGTIYLYDVISNPSNVKVEVATNKQIKYVNYTPVHILLSVPNDNTYDLIVKNEDRNYEGLGIQGTKYNVTINGENKGPLTTDVNGIAKITNQTQNGEITINIAENTIATGYRADNNNSATIKIQKGTAEYKLETKNNSNPEYAKVEVDEEHGIITVTFKNETKLELTMQKNDINSENELQGAQFEITEEEIDNTGNVIEGTKKIVTTSSNNTTDINGLLYFDLGVSKQNKTIKYTFTETQAPVGYDVITPITVTVKFDSFGNIIKMEDDSFRAKETIKNKRHMVVTIGNGTENQEYSVKIITEDSQTLNRINGSIFEIQVIDEQDAQNRATIGTTNNLTSKIAGNTTIFERGATKLNKITAEGNVKIKFRQLETAVGYIYGNNQTSGTVIINAHFDVVDGNLEKPVTLTTIDEAGFDVECDSINKVITVKILNDPQVNFEITKVDSVTGERLPNAKFNITGAVLNEQSEVTNTYNEELSATDQNGYTKMDISYPYVGKTVIYTISEEKLEGYNKLDDIILSVKYDINGSIKACKVLSNKDDVNIKEPSEKTITKRVVTGETSFTDMSIQVPTGIGSKILQLEINNKEEILPKDYQIQIGKANKAEGYPYLIPGAKYEITVTQEYGKAVTTWTDITNEEGIIISPYFSGYGEIEVSIKELQAPEGYKLDEVVRTARFTRSETTQKIELISSDLECTFNEDFTIVGLRAVDEMIAGKYDIVINKVDAKNGKLIEKPAKIKLEMLETFETVKQEINDQTGEVTETVEKTSVRDIIVEDTTDSNGRIVVNGLKTPNKPGKYTYYLTELKAPKGYKGIAEEIEIEVTFIENENQEIIIESAVAKNSEEVKVGKTSQNVMNMIVLNTKEESGNDDDNDDDITIEEDEFGIDLRKVDTKLEQITTTEAKFILTDLDKNTDTEIITDELGRAEVVKLKMPQVAGTYKYMLREEEAPKGYKKIEDPMYILVRSEKDEEEKIYIETIVVKGNNILHANKAEEGKLPNKLIKLQVINEDLPYTIKIEKHHEADPDYPKFIEGVQFDIKITQEFGKELVIRKTETTNSDGIIEIKDIEGYGRIKVEIKEISAPEQYKQDFEIKYLEFYRDKGSKELRQYDSNVGYELKQETGEVVLMPINELKEGLYDIVINKVDKENNTMITNNPATFSLYMIRKYHKTNDDGSIQVTEIREPVIQNAQTNDLGILIKDGAQMPTEPGTYIFELEENKAPEGYKGLKEPVRYQVTLQNSEDKLIISDSKILTITEDVQILTSKKQFISFAVGNTIDKGGSGGVLTNTKPYTLVINKIDSKTGESQVKSQ